MNVDGLGVGLEEGYKVGIWLPLLLLGGAMTLVNSVTDPRP